ncbi:MAG TPA: hypothetical protein VJ302_03955 [Blastocatellia bacterium]|nr:hypothetical protein [Blastocatellia bacterium]
MTTLAAEPTSTSVEAAGYQPITAPGTLMSVFGTGFPGGLTINDQATEVPLSTDLSGVQVCVDNVPSPMLFVSVRPDGTFQLNFQMPWEAKDSGGSTPVEVFYLGARLTTEILTVSTAAPGLFTVNASGTGQAAALTYNATTAEYTPNSVSSPARVGGILILYGSGMDLPVNKDTGVQGMPESGDAAPNSPLYITPTLPTVTVGGKPATVLFSGLAPGFVGLWQINIQLAPDTPTGNTVPVVVNYDGQSTRAGVTVAVQSTP